MKIIKNKSTRHFFCAILLLGLSSPLFGQDNTIATSSSEDTRAGGRMSCFNNAIDNGDFESFDLNGVQFCNQSGSACNANLTFGCISETAPFQTCPDYSWGDWWVSHGTPELWKDVFGNHSAMMWSGRANVSDGDNTIYGEGLFNYCLYFNAGNTYNLSLRMRKSGPALTNVFIKLTNTIGGPNDYNNTGFVVGEKYEIPNPSGAQTVYTGDGFNSSAFTTINITFTPQDDYNLLWIYPYQEAADGSLSLLYIDDFCLNCEDNEDVIIYTQPTPLPSYTYANILVNGKDNATVYSDDDVTFVAGTEVLIEPNFAVQPGGIFTAIIATIPECELLCVTGNTLMGSGGPAALQGGNTDTPARPGTPFSRVEVYPNPSIGQFTISFANDFNQANFQYTVTNALGEVLLYSPKSYNGDSFDLSGHPPGIYFLQIKGEETQVTKRLILQ